MEEHLRSARLAESQFHNIQILMNNLQKKIPRFLSGDSIRMSWKETDTKETARKQGAGLRGRGAAASGRGGIESKMALAAKKRKATNGDASVSSTAATDAERAQKRSRAFYVPPGQRNREPSVSVSADPMVHTYSTGLPDVPTARGRGWRRGRGRGRGRGGRGRRGARPRLV